MKRYLTENITKDLAKKMVFIGGPRQVGKTTLAKSLLPSEAGYLNWDIPSHRERILKRELPPGDFWVFDELHRYVKWRAFLKGLFDEYGATRKILVTGSARLDLYRFGGDTLQGRYHFIRLYPLSAAELGMEHQADLESLFRLGGFPEPYFSGSEETARRWSLEYRSNLIREEITSIERIRDLGTLELLMIRLPELVGSPLSINALREDLSISHEAASRWLDILERFYSFVRIAPFGTPKIRAVKKERKHYHLDWTLVADRAARFENLVAIHLLKWVHYQRDLLGKDLDLRFFRDVDGREVDFVIVEGRKPVQFIECKLADTGISKGLRYLKERFSGVDAFQIHFEGDKDYVSDGVRVMPALRFLRTLV